MKHLFVSHETAKTLIKELGFDEPCFGLYNQIKELCYPQLHYGEWKSFYDQRNNDKWITAAPTHQQVIDWFREEHHLHIEVKYHDIGHYEYAIKYGNVFNGKSTFPKYYEALTAAIDEAIKLIKP